MVKDRIKEARKRVGLTQSQVAEEIGVARSTYTGYETGNVVPDMRTLALIMKALGVDANYLLQDEMAMEVKKVVQLTADEQELVDCYRLLNHDGQRSLLMLARMHTQNEEYQKEDTQRKMA